MESEEKMIFGKDKNKDREEQSAEEETLAEDVAESSGEKKKSTGSDLKTVAQLCRDRNVKSWKKAGMMALKKWNEDTKVTLQQFVDGLEEFNSRPQGG